AGEYAEGGRGAQKAEGFLQRAALPRAAKRTFVRFGTAPTSIIYNHMELSPQETILLGTAIAFELSKNQDKKSLKTTCELLSQVLHTLLNLIKN
ncbi:MAG: hypothetical protein IKB21_02890, partial [Clostridia bacterium]|nr:hypothetical protein [Clostridia bacterium]